MELEMSLSVSDYYRENFATLHFKPNSFQLSSLSIFLELGTFFHFH